MTGAELVQQEYAPRPPLPTMRGSRCPGDKSRLTCCWDTPTISATGEGGLETETPGVPLPRSSLPRPRPSLGGLFPAFDRFS